MLINLTMMMAFVFRDPWVVDNFAREQTRYFHTWVGWAMFALAAVFFTCRIVADWWRDK